LEKKLEPSGLLFSESDSNSRSSSFCRAVRFTGVSTTARCRMSPCAPPRSAGIPLPRRRICLPDWLPAGTFTRLRPPSIVGTSTSPPSAAVAMLTGTRQCRSCPSRWKSGCSRTSMKM
jgi:hypothetical protein